MNTVGIVARISQFARLLRDNGFVVSPDAVSDAVRALAEQSGPPRRPILRQVLALLFCQRREELVRFDEIFDAYWLGHIGAKRTLTRETSLMANSAVERNTQIGGPSIPSGLATYFEWRSNQSTPQEEPFEPGQAVLGGQARSENRRRVNFGKVHDPEEAEDLLQLAERLGARLRQKLSRRYKTSSKGQLVDMRRSLRRAVTTNGLPIRLAKRKRQRPRVSLIIFVDVSGSMDAYSLFFAKFMQALMRGFPRAHAFLFHTKLVHVSDVFREARADVLMDKLSLIGQGWSGGTQIGAAFDRFNRHYGKALGGSRTIGLLMSDGYDAGPTETLRASAWTLKRHCRKLIWLNPLLGRDSYAPEAAAAEHLSAVADLILPAHNLASLSRLEGVIANA